MSAEPNPSAARDREPGKGAVPVLVTDLASKTLAVKEGDTFLYCDLEGNLDHGGDYGLGLYSLDTRYLSHFRMTISGRDPVLLSSSSERGYMSYVDLTNPELFTGGECPLGGDEQTVNQGMFEPGAIDYRAVIVASWRQIIDLSDLDASVGTHTVGQSGNPASPHFNDLFPLWSTGRYHPLPFTRSAVEAQTATRLLLHPEE